MLCFKFINYSLTGEQGTWLFFLRFIFIFAVVRIHRNGDRCGNESEKPFLPWRYRYI